jgi:hypothetical protein
MYFHEEALPIRGRFAGRICDPEERTRGLGKVQSGGA